MVVVGERTVGAQRQFQRGQGEAGIGGQKSAGGVDRLQDDFAAASAAHAETEDAEQFSGGGRFAGIDLDGVRLAGQLFQFVRLGEVAVHQLEVFGLFQRFVVMGRLIAVGDHVARQCRQNVGGVGLGRQGGHAGEGAQRAGDIGGALGGRGFGFGRGAEGDGYTAGGAIGIEVGAGGGAVAG